MQQHIATAQSSGRQEAPALTVGLDVDDRHIQVCVLDPEARVVREQRVRTTALALRQELGNLPASRVVPDGAAVTVAEPPPGGARPRSDRGQRPAGRADRP